MFTFTAQRGGHRRVEKVEAVLLGSQSIRSNFKFNERIRKKREERGGEGRLTTESLPPREISCHYIILLKSLITRVIQRNRPCGRKKRERPPYSLFSGKVLSKVPSKNCIPVPSNEWREGGHCAGFISVKVIK